MRGQFGVRRELLGAVGLALAPGWVPAVACLARTYGAGAGGAGFDAGAYALCLLPVLVGALAPWAVVMTGCLRSRASSVATGSSRSRTGAGTVLGERAALLAGMACAVLAALICVMNELAAVVSPSFLALALGLGSLGGAGVQYAWVARCAEGSGAPGLRGCVAFSCLGLALAACAALLAPCGLPLMAALMLLPVAAGLLYLAPAGAGSVGAGNAGGEVAERGAVGSEAACGEAVASVRRDISGSVAAAEVDGTLGNIPVGSDEADPAVPRDGYTLSVCLRHALSSALFGFVFALMMYNFLMTQFARLEAWAALALPVGVLVAGAFLLLGRVAHAESPVHFAYRLLVVPVVLAFFPFNPGTAESLHFAFFFTFAAMAAFAVLAPLLAHDAVERWHVRLARPWGAMVAGCCAGWIVGCLVALGEAHFGVLTGTYAIFIQAIACIMLGAVASNLLVLDRQSLVAAYASMARGALTPARGGEGLAGRCRAVAASHGLTRREGEVLVVLARGYSLARVCEELSISEGTAISHRRSVYAKLGVHSRDELLDLVDAAEE